MPSSRTLGFTSSWLRSGGVEEAPLESEGDVPVKAEGDVLLEYVFTHFGAPLSWPSGTDVYTYRPHTFRWCSPRGCQLCFKTPHPGEGGS